MTMMWRIIMMVILLVLFAIAAFASPWGIMALPAKYWDTMQVSEQDKYVKEYVAPIYFSTHKDCANVNITIERVVERKDDEEFELVVFWGECKKPEMEAKGGDLYG